MTDRPPVAIIMGSQSDWATMNHAADTLEALDIAYDARIVSAHRTPDRMVAFAKGARAEGFKVIIAGAGGAAHLPGMTAAMTPLPVLGVPVQVESPVGPGQPALHRADAGRHSGRHARHRRGRRDQRRPARRRRARPVRRRACRAARRLARAARALPSPNTRSGLSDLIAARRHDRHSRRRPARPHAGAWPPRGWASHGRSSSRGRLPGLPGRHPADCRRL